MIPFVGLASCCFILWVIFAGTYLDTEKSWDPRGIWKSCLSDSEFDYVLEAVFSDPNKRYTGFDMVGGGYEIWVANDYYAFKVNGRKGFSVMQKRRFFKKFKAYLDSLKKEDEFITKIRQAVKEKEFTEALEKKLSN